MITQWMKKKVPERPNYFSSEKKKYSIMKLTNMPGNGN
jgi:hypothetical protein